MRRWPRVDQLQRVHPREYVEHVRTSSPAHGIVHLDPDTAMSPGTLQAALRSAGRRLLCHRPGDAR
jgi:acetoin utilization deacetylase AcuC-like enzyme